MVCRIEIEIYLLGKMSVFFVVLENVTKDVH
jgi:hypothetical protein